MLRGISTIKTLHISGTAYQRQINIKEGIRNDFDVNYYIRQYTYKL